MIMARSNHPEAYLLYEYPLDFEPNAISAVQECYGKQYRVSRKKALPGEILSRPINHGSCQTFSTNEDNTSTCNWKIVAPVHINTMYAIMRRAGVGVRERLSRGYWYEVHGD